MRRTALVLAVVAVLTMTGCTLPRPGTASPPPSAAPTAEAPAEAERHAVPWEDYAPEVQQRIDAATDAADCAALQAEFNNADANNDATMSRTGHNNADLMAYIDEALQVAGCY